MTESNDSTDRDGDDADVRTNADSEPDAVFDEAPGEPQTAARTRAPIRFSLIIAGVVVLLDQLTKHWAVNALSDGASRDVFWKLHWNLAFNSGMAFSQAQGIGPYIGALALVVVVVLVLSLRKANGRGSALAAGLVVGGACGNLADRLFRGDGWLHGSVVDFIDFEFWPIFNIADMGVSIGGVLIVLAAVFDSKSTGSTSGRSTSNTTSGTTSGTSAK